MRQHAISWLIWVCGAAVCALLTRNPLYQVLLALSAGLVLAVKRQQSGVQNGWLGLVRLGALIWVVTIPFNAFMLHQGNIVLFTLPPHWPLIGGNITLEAVVYGASAGLVLWVLLLLFSAFNTALDASELIRLAPPVFAQASIITSIGLTFVPQMIKSSQDIREAQRVRGHHFRSWRDLAPMVMPLLTTSLERAMMLAESMEARGFGAESSSLGSRQRLWLSVLELAGLGMLLGSLVLRLWYQQQAWWVTLLMLLSVVSLGIALYKLSQHTRRSRYRRQPWHISDTIICATSLLPTVAVVFVRITDNLSLTYYPFPPNGLAPAFNPWLGLSLALFCAAGVISALRETPMTPDTRLPGEVAE